MNEYVFFAVAADEVRTLARRSGSASSDSNKLVSESNSKAQKGTEMASKTAAH